MSRVGGHQPGWTAVGGVLTAHFQRSDATIRNALATNIEKKSQ